MDHLQAAQSLIASFGNVPPQAHSVYVKTDVDPNTKEFIRKLCVSVHPKAKGMFSIPDVHEGFVVEKTPWPKELK